MKLIHIENVLILVNLILILYLVYVLSNRTIEKFYHEYPGLDPSVPGFEPHTHRDLTRGPVNTGNEGCGSACSGGWERPPIPSIVKLVSNQDAISITDNTLTISNIVLNPTGDPDPNLSLFYPKWFFEIGVQMGPYTITEQIRNPDTGRSIGSRLSMISDFWIDVDTITINNSEINKTSGKNASYFDRYNLRDIFDDNGTLNGNIIINLDGAHISTSRLITVKLGILDENGEGINNSTDDQRLTFTQSKYYTPCVISGGDCDSGNDCCGTEAVCSSGRCQSTCPENYYSNTNGVCEVCDETDYDWPGTCPSWNCNTSRPVETGTRKAGISTSCPQTRDKDCTNDCIPECSHHSGFGYCPLRGQNGIRRS